jgi:hypothetical protein
MEVDRMTKDHSVDDARPGDWVQVHGLPGRAAREGQILELLGEPGHRHFRVRWDEAHESIFFPTDGAVVVPRSARESESPGR